jgi:hypothetical protein
MAIDVETERLITLRQYCAKRPPGRNGRPMSLSTAYRQVFHGVRGVPLEHVRFGGHIYTSEEAVQRFVTRLTELRGPPRPDRPADVSPHPAAPNPASRKAAERAGRELAKRGI